MDSLDKKLLSALTMGLLAISINLGSIMVVANQASGYLALATPLSFFAGQIFGSLATARPLW